MTERRERGWLPEGSGNPPRRGVLEDTLFRRLEEMRKKPPGELFELLERTLDVLRATKEALLEQRREIRSLATAVDTLRSRVDQLVQHRPEPRSRAGARTESEPEFPRGRDERATAYEPEPPSVRRAEPEPEPQSSPSWKPRSNPRRSRNPHRAGARARSAARGRLDRRTPSQRTLRPSSPAPRTVLSKTASVDDSARRGQC